LTAEQKEKKTKLWLLMDWQAEYPEQYTQNRQRLCNEITTTFATSFTAEVGLAQVVTVPALQVYGKQETGKKYLVNPQMIATAKL